MTIQLPKALADYFAAVNQRDIDAMLRPFAADATVKDEGKTMTGREAIRGWIEETTRKYGIVIEPEELNQEGDTSTVRARISGNFPGSPTRLVYRFWLRGKEILNLEIG